MLRDLQRTDWNKLMTAKGTIIMTFKPLPWSKISFAAPTYTQTVIRALTKTHQTIQNAAVRTVSGCHQRASADHLSETQLLRVNHSIWLLCSQYLASSLHFTNQSFTIVSQQTSRVTNNFRSCFKSVESPYLTYNTINPTDYDYIFKDIHHPSFHIATQNQPLQPILQDNS